MQLFIDSDILADCIVFLVVYHQFLDYSSQFTQVLSLPVVSWLFMIMKPQATQNFLEPIFGHASGISGSGISWDVMQVCTSLQTDNHASTPINKTNRNKLIKLTRRHKVSLSASRHEPELLCILSVSEQLQNSSRNLYVLMKTCTMTKHHEEKYAH